MEAFLGIRVAHALLLIEDPVAGVVAMAAANRRENDKTLRHQKPREYTARLWLALAAVVPDEYRKRSVARWFVEKSDEVLPAAAIVDRFSGNGILGRGGE